MSLIVYPYAFDPDTGVLRRLTPRGAPGDELAGFEVWRTQVWGSNAARELGLTVLPSLAEQDVYAEGAELDLLARDVELLLATPLDGFCARVGTGPDTLLLRLENVRNAIRRARSVEGDRGGVYIG